ncbi:formamidopyrimidine-DNA glycosylase [Pullulanibacillus pueri]|uniref:Formamidopyrimidine-DNA glycosylase n=1 Tax=Pullulanibacillus pueri TaxID=1437324 RepID=A0A8J3ENJ9_9BACL|nr:DNA-formamidopyrimidine glycosylase [Pullulanibacillus pueri]MBM7683469.1 formamidopyrimidine-DNA glycosylase [Pullulanibacillus pueri]GGH86778.1 formamidopyrimidine-DNA glycosylase [Pullulanibacillus pueri]
MPELPEVETVKETLKHLIIGKTIQDVTIRWPKIIKEPDDGEVFTTLLRGETFQTIERRGKFIRFILDHYVLVSHLRMEGKYSLEEATAVPDKHTHVIFHFTDGTQLFYKDVRKFGTMHLFLKGEEWHRPPLLDLGPEPLDEAFTEEVLKQAFSKTERMVKAVLLDQKVLVGLGNIYVDEALFRAGIHPTTKAKTLTQQQIKTLVESIRATLSEAVKMGGSSVRTYLNGQGRMGMFQQKLYVYDRAGEPCKKCGTPIEKIKAAGRGTHFCPSCQVEVRV